MNPSGESEQMTFEASARYRLLLLGFNYFYFSIRSKLKEGRKKNPRLHTLTTKTPNWKKTGTRNLSCCKKKLKDNSEMDTYSTYA